MFGEAVEVEGVVPVSKGEPNGLLLLDGVPGSKREEEIEGVLEGVLPVPNEELAPAPASDDEDEVVEEDEEPPPVSSWAHSPSPLHNPPATNRAIQCR